MNSETVPLSEYCTVRKGLSYKGEFIHKEGPALLGIGTIKQGGGFRPENVRTYGGPYKDEHVLRAGDVYVALTSQDGWLIGSPAMVPKDFSGIGITTHHDAKIEWETDDDTMRDFLYWLMHTYEFTRYCINFSAGTTVYATDPKDVESFEIPKELSPNRITMTETFNLISKLEGCVLYLTELIESSIEALFRSWFIDFDPVKARAEGEVPVGLDEENAGLFPDSFEDSELGRIPTGWSVQYLSDLYDVQRGFSYSTEVLDKSGEGFPMLNLASFIEGGGYKSLGLKHISCKFDNKFLIEKEDVLIATVDLTPGLRVVGSPLIPPSNLNNKSIFSQDLLRLRAKPENKLDRGFLFQWLKIRRGILKQWSSGTTVSRFPPSALDYFPVLIPTPEILKKFDGIFANFNQLREEFEDLLSTLEGIKKSLLIKLSLEIAEAPESK